MTEIKLTTDVYHNNAELFYPHHGEGEYDNVLAMSVRYAPIKSVRTQIEAALNLKLDYFKKWNPNGEAHITVVTPDEYWKVLKQEPAKMTMKEIDAIANRYNIQDARMVVLGLGSAKKMIGEKEAETFFVIVDSADLRNIRQQIFYEFTRRGGDRAAFDPTWFFPHITVGYIETDLHESNGVLKNLKHTLDKRLPLKIAP